MQFPQGFNKITKGETQVTLFVTAHRRQIGSPAYPSKLCIGPSV